MPSGQQYSNNCCGQDTAMNAQIGRWKPASRGMCAVSQHLPRDSNYREGHCHSTLEKREQRHLHPVTTLSLTSKWHVDTICAVMPWGGSSSLCFSHQKCELRSKRPHHKSKGDIPLYIWLVFQSVQVTKRRREGPHELDKAEPWQLNAM